MKTDLIGRILRRWEDEAATGVGTREWKKGAKQSFIGGRDGSEGQLGSMWMPTGMDFGFWCTREFRGCVTMCHHGQRYMPTV